MGGGATFFRLHHAIYCPNLGSSASTRIRDFRVPRGTLESPFQRVISATWDGRSRVLDCRLGVFSATCWCRAASPTRPAAVAAVLPALPAPPPHPSHHRRADFPASGTLLCTLARGPPRPPMARPAELRGRRGGRGHQAGTRPRSLTQPLPFLMRNGCALRSAHQGFLQRWAAPAAGGQGAALAVDGLTAGDARPRP